MPKFRTNAGDTAELALAQKVAEAVMLHYEIHEPEAEDIFLGDHTHECLRKGAATVAWEGGPYEWAILWGEAPIAKRLEKELGVFLEPLNSFTMAVYSKLGAAR